MSAYPSARRPSVFFVFSSNFPSICSSETLRGNVIFSANFGEYSSNLWTMNIYSMIILSVYLVVIADYLWTYLSMLIELEQKSTVKILEERQKTNRKARMMTSKSLWRVWSNIIISYLIDTIFLSKNIISRIDTLQKMI